MKGGEYGRYYSKLPVFHLESNSSTTINPRSQKNHTCGKLLAPEAAVIMLATPGRSPRQVEPPSPPSGRLAGSSGSEAVFPAGQIGHLGPPPRKRARKQEVLDEDTYVEAIETIIERDFFPDNAKLQNRLDWLEAVRSGDPDKIRSVQMSIVRQRAERAAAGLTPSLAGEHCKAVQELTSVWEHLVGCGSNSIRPGSLQRMLTCCPGQAPWSSSCVDHPLTGVKKQAQTIQAYAASAHWSALPHQEATSTAAPMLRVRPGLIPPGNTMSS